ncbi:hypothetical protein Hanom_Chr00s001392g01681161 [Helianthus anomalus]
MCKFLFFSARNDVSTTVIPDAMAKVDYSIAASFLALPDTRKPDPHPPEGTTVEYSVRPCLLFKTN